MRKITAILLAAALGGAVLVPAGCAKQPRKGDIQIDISTVASKEQEEEPTKEAPAQGAPKTEADPGEPTGPISNKPTQTKGGVVNHGHSISEVLENPREREIRRSSDVVLTEEEAYKYLIASVTLQNMGLHFELTETSDKDPGAYMWYKFTVYRGDLKVENAEFFVLAFTDGTICEGRADFLQASFYDADDVITPNEAQKIFVKANPQYDVRMRFVEKCYLYSGKYQERCPVVYVYRYSKGRILVNAKTGDMIGLWKDQID